MSPLPPLLPGTVLAFWGWRTGLWWLGLALALVTELAPRAGWRWELDLRERQRVADLCTLLFILAGIWLYLTRPRLGEVVILLLQWAPALLFPLLAVQLFGGRRGLELSVLFLSLRGAGAGGEERVDLRPAYLLLCLLAAAMVAPPDQWYYPSLALLAGWALWPLRARGRAFGAWGVSLSLAIALGYGVALGLQQLQYRLEDLAVAWLAGWLDGSLDPYRVTTAIGDVGELKQSERILLRVRTAEPLHSPLLLRSTSYDRYLEGTWLASHDAFQPLPQTPSGWRLRGDARTPHRLAISLRLEEGRGLLPLPGGSRTIRGLEGARLSRNGYSVVKVLEGPALARYGVSYGAGFDDRPPQPSDLRVPARDQAAVSTIATRLTLADLPPAQALARLRTLFERDFSYSLRLDAPGAGSALAHFLLERRTGHCEYFASAAALILRQVGIPSRYARGWSVQEYSPLEQAYVARARHAHAWVLAWVEGAWRDFDPTPPDWGALEARQRPWWGWFQDLWERLLYLLAGGESTGASDPGRLIWLTLPLVALLVWRIARRGRRVRGDPRRTTAVKSVPPSPFAPVESALARRGQGRRESETLREWVGRLARAGEPAGHGLLPAVELYYRDRYDPAGLDPVGHGRLRQILADCSARLAPETAGKTNA